MSTPESPLPWKIKGNSNGEFVYDANDEPIAEVENSRQFKAWLCAVRCVKSHAALVEALKELRFWCRNASVLASDLSQPEIGLLLKTMNQIIENGLRNENEKDNQTA